VTRPQPDPIHVQAELSRIAAMLSDAMDAVEALRAQLAPPLRDQEFLEPRVIAQRLPIGEAWVRKLCKRAHDRGDPGVRKIGERGWEATIPTIERERRR
jgi:hypothetical protein